jgi:hypothetical protein
MKVYMQCWCRGPLDRYDEHAELTSLPEAGDFLVVGPSAYLGDAAIRFRVQNVIPNEFGCPIINLRRTAPYGSSDALQNQIDLIR